MRKPKRRPVKPTAKPDFHNLNHPNYSSLIEFAFQSGKTKFFQFKQDTEIRTGRYMIIQNILQEVYLRIDRERLAQYIKRITSEIDGSRGQINIGNALAYLGQLNTMTELAFEPDTVYRLASVIYFDETEDLRKWDRKYNEQKIVGWKENGTLDFFFNKPFRELIGLKDISLTDLKDYLEKVAALSEGYRSVMNSETPTQ